MEKYQEMEEMILETLAEEEAGDLEQEQPGSPAAQDCLISGFTIQ